MGSELEELQKQLHDCSRQIHELTAQINHMEGQIKKFYVQQDAASAGEQTEAVFGRHMPAPAHVPENRQPIKHESAKEQGLFAGDAEAVIGKRIMGVAAAVLIFISLILFATVFIPKMGELAKFLLLCLVSGVFTGIGLHNLNKAEKNAFYQSITSCGVGAAYITLFLSNVYFHMIGDLALYILLLIWALCALYLSTRYGRVFQVIGNLGILISVIYGTLMCSVTKDADKMVLLIVYFIVGSMTFFLCHAKERKGTMLNQIFQLVDLLFLIVTTVMLWDEPMRYVAVGLLAVFLIGMLVRLFVCLRENNIGASMGIGIPASALLIVLCLPSIEQQYVAEVVALVITIAILVALEIRFFRLGLATWKYASANIWIALLSLTSVIVLAFITPLYDVTGVALVALPFAIYGFGMGHRNYQILALVAGGLLLVSDLKFPLQSIWLVLFLGVTIWLLNRKEGSYKTEYKIGCYFYWICGVLTFFSRLIPKAGYEYEEIWKLIGFILLLVVNICMGRTRLAKNWQTGEQERSFDVIYYGVHGILMLYNLFMIQNAEDPVLHALYILTALALFTVNVDRQLAAGQKYEAVYVALKYTALLVVILDSFSAEDYVMSIVLILFAIACVSVGFWIKVKTLRIYGLLLSLLCVIKLIMVDITYDNTIGRAISFFISGILCFAISAVYYHAEKKIEREQH